MNFPRWTPAGGNSFPPGVNGNVEVAGGIRCPYCDKKLAPSGSWFPWTDDGVYRPHCDEEEEELTRYGDSNV